MRIWLGFLAVLGLTLVAAVILLVRTSVPELPAMGELPPFTFTNQTEQRVDNEALRGKVWIANFMFTSCPTACPALTRTMKTLVEELPDREDLQFVSFSVDPETDTPAVLREYADEDTIIELEVKGERDQSSSFSEEGMHRMDVNSCAYEISRSQL